MTDAETVVRVGSVVAAAAVLVGPWLVDRAKAAWAAAQGLVPRPEQRPEVRPVPADDLHVVLEIAKRLRDAGLPKGVELCQQLIDVMLEKKP